jgi:hypothetical protein
MPVIIATVLMLAGGFEAAAEIVFGLAAYQSRSSPTTVKPKPAESAKDARSAPCSAMVPAMMITASAASAAAFAAFKSLLSSLTVITVPVAVVLPSRASTL